MLTFGSRIIEQDSTGRARYTKIKDIDGPRSVTTHIKSPYRTLYYVNDQMMAAQVHDTVRDAIRFHKEIAAAIHAAGALESST